MKSPALLRALLLVVAFGLSGAAGAKTAAAPAQEAPPPDPNETCLACHADASAKGANGKSIAVDAAIFAKSVHGEMQFKCTDRRFGRSVAACGKAAARGLRELS